MDMHMEVGAGSGAELAALAEQAFVFGYPLVLLGVAPTTPQRFVPAAEPGLSTAWLDVSREPLVLSLPNTRGKPYALTMVSAWAEVFGEVNDAATGGRRSAFAVVGPNWKGKVPAGPIAMSAPTEIVRIVARTEEDVGSFWLMPLSAWGKEAKRAEPARSTGAAVSAVEAVRAMNGLTFFSRLGQLLVGNPPPPGAEPMVAVLEAMGMKSGKPFRPDAPARAALDEGVQRGWARVMDEPRARTAVEIAEGRWIPPTR
ncbi:MAG: DUF1254 domain-containing protein [Myxococcaceae bacterium]|nr:DUF1254 domain-containing protein [Myxococcaceae bacterium]